MPKNILELYQAYARATNPVTRCSYRQRLRDRLEGLEFLIPYLPRLAAWE